jgi:hypothetical protein
MAIIRAYEEIIDFIAAGTDPERVATFRASEEVRQRVADLVRREKSDSLTADERSELEHYLQIEHLMRLAKVRARKHLSQRSHPSGP